MCSLPFFIDLFVYLLLVRIVAIVWLFVIAPQSLAQSARDLEFMATS